jgi:hypothetical protein
MPSFPYVPPPVPAQRKYALGAARLNRQHSNIEALDEAWRIEHFADGQHNALEIPWLLGHIDDAATPTGYLLDTAFGGGTLARPGTGEYTSSIVSGVVPTDASGNLAAAVLASVADSAIEAKPHTITFEMVSATSVKFRIRELSSALGAGNTWADQNRDFDFALHAPSQPVDASELIARTVKTRGQYLTEAATDWSALVQNQGKVRKLSLLEHSSAGVHSLNRIAKAAALVSFAPTAYTLGTEEGVASVSRQSIGVAQLTMDANFTSTNTMAVFPDVQPATPGELVIINGRGFATGAGTSTFRFYIYAYDGTNWDRADRSFSAVMFGVVA